MRKLFLSLALMCMMGFAVVAQNYQIPLNGKSYKTEVVSKDFSHVNMAFSFDMLSGFDVITKSGESFTQLTLQEAYAIGQIGSPKLPAVKKLIEVPFGATVSVKVTNFTEQEFKLNEYGIQNRLMPAQPSLRKDEDPDKVKFEFDKQAYGKNAFIGNPIASVEILGTMRGVQIARLVIAPVDYNPVTGDMKVYNNIEVEINFNGADKGKSQDVMAATYSPYFEVAYSKLVNHDPKGVFEDHPDLTKYPVKYLIISDRMFETTLQPFIEWKTKMGFKVVTAYTDVIGTSITAIKNYITAQYNAGTESDPAPSFFVLVGDTPQIPASATGSESGRATDLYYGSIDGDYFPEIYYGRLSATTTTQLQNQLDKILYYQQYQFTDPTYLNNVTLIAGADGTWNPAVAQPTIEYGTTNFFNTSHGYVTISDYLTSPYTGCYTNEKFQVSLINYTAHCNETCWGDPNLDISQVPSISNPGKYPLAIANCCLSGDFGYGECMGEAMMRGANKGSVAYIGSSPSSYWFEDFYWAVGAFPIEGNNNGYVPTMEETTLGAYEAPFASDYVSVDALVFVGNLAVTEVDIQGYPQHSTPTYYWQAYNTLGDPSTVIFNTEADNNTVSHLPVLPIGLTTFTVSALPGSYVAISKDGELHGAAFVDESGEVDVPITPVLAGGLVDIVVTKPQYKPYIVQVNAAALNAPFVVLDSYTINDATGNNNQAADFGETIKLNVTMKNVGSQTATGIVGAVSGTDSYITLSGTASATFGTIVANGTSVVNNAYTFVVDDNIPDQHLATFVITATNADTSWTSNLKIRANAPELEIGALSIDDDNAGIPTVLDPGETADVVITVTNNGHAAISGVTAALSTTNSLLTINNGSFSIGTLAAGETKSATFNVTASASAALETPVTVNFAVSAAAYSVSGDKEIIIGLIPSYPMTDGTITACIGRFYDSGGADGEYGNSENLVTTISPSVSGNIVQVNFTAFETESGYDYLHIYNGPTTSSNEIEGSPFDGTDNPGTIMGLNESGSLTFAFTSDGSATRLGWVAEFSCADVANPPAAAQNPVPANGATDINLMVPLSWDAVSGAFSYDVYVGIDNLPETVTANVTTNAYNFSFESNTTYVWKVVPKNNAGEATGCATWTFTTGEVAADVNIQDGELHSCNALFYDAGGSQNYNSNEDFTYTIYPDGNGGKVQAEFLEFEVEDTYDFLYIYDGTSVSATSLGEFTGTASPGTVVATNNDGALTFRFTSDGSVQKTGWKAVITCSATTAPTCAENPVPANDATNVNYDTDLSWNSVSGAASYDVYIGKDNLPETAVNVTGHTYNAELEASSTYVWKVVPKNAVGEATGCSTWTFTTGTTGVVDPDGTLISMYPNPVKDMLHLQNIANVKNISIVNMVGQIGLSANVNTNVTDLSTAALGKGIYFVKLTLNSGKVLNLKLVKE